MVGRAEISEKPELLWDHPGLEGLFVRLQDEFEIRERHQSLERRELDARHGAAAARHLLEALDLYFDRTAETQALGHQLFMVLVESVGLRHVGGPKRLEQRQRQGRRNPGARPRVHGRVGDMMARAT